MRRAYRKMWRAVPCAARKCPRPESAKNIEEILNAKLEPIEEEPESDWEEDSTPTRHNWRVFVKNRRKNEMGCEFLPRFRLVDSYALFVTGFASKGSFGGLLQY